MFTPHRAFIVAALALGGLVSACGGSGESGGGVLQGVGRIPGLGASAANNDALINAQLAAVKGTTLGSRSAGNRLLVIGDSIMAGTASRYGGDMCSALVPLGWRVDVEAQAGEMVDFGTKVLMAKLSEGWDTAVVFLGTNFGGDVTKYKTSLTYIIEKLAPRPTLLLTTSLFRPVQSSVNDAITQVAQAHPNVTLMDWTTASAQDGVLSGDHIHPTPAGRKVLVNSVAAALGLAPAAPGKCLASDFTDDSKVTGVMPTTSIGGATASTVQGATPSSIAGATPTSNAASPSTVAGASATTTSNP